MGLDQLQGYITGIILSIVIIAGGILFITNFADANPTLASDGKINDFNETMNKANEVKTAVDSMSGSIENASTTNTGILGWLNALVGSIFDGLKALFISFSFVSTAAEDSAELFKIPPIFMGLLVLILTIIIVFAIWSAITKV